jgi:hypothetical protein
MRSPAERVTPEMRATTPARDAGSRAPAQEQNAGGPALDGWRVALEWFLRALAAVSLIWLLVQAAARRPANVRETASAGALASALVRWSTVQAPSAVNADLDSAPPSASRDWLAALNGAGTRVSWHARSLVPIALAASPVADPVRITRLQMAAPPGTRVILRDGVGILDTVPVGALGGANILVPGIRGAVEAVASGASARATTPGAASLRRVLVLGQVGWESRFVVDALEERGWRVDAQLGLAPGSELRQGIASPIDTARYAAVVVTDSSATSLAGHLVAYVRSGGGLLVAGSAAAIPVLRDLVPGTTGTLMPSTPMDPGDSLAPAAMSRLALLPIAGLRPGAVPLEWRDHAVAVAARRVGPGRIVQSGYLDTWRWRMGSALGEGAHRTWWAGLVSAVASAPVAERRAGFTSDNAPAAALFAALGPMAANAAGKREPAGSRDQPWLFALIVAALIAEWASRRLRGAA